MNEVELLKLKSDVTNMFVMNEADISKPNVIAAIAEVAGDMALALDDSKSPEEMSEAVLAIFDARENEMVRGLVGGMHAHVKSVIGFSADTKDYGHARAVYKTQKQEYDQLYNELSTVYNSLETKRTK